MLAVVAQESAAARCLVIGEDLGTVPEGLREQLAEWGVWSYRVMLFERDASGAFRAPRDYPQRALVTFGTHDLPTFEGWRSGRDLDLRRRIGLAPGESEGERHAACGAMSEALARHAGSADLAIANVLRYLARTPSGLLALAVEDAFGVAEQINVPATVDEHPNWRRRLPISLEDFPSDARLRELAGILAAEGRSVAG
jgi:4-alpha-glucanotransferase